MNLMHDNDQVVELTDSELTEITGTGGFGLVGACGACGLISTCGACGLGVGPFVTAFSNVTAFNVALNVSLNVGVANNTAFVTQFG